MYTGKKNGMNPFPWACSDNEFNCSITREELFLFAEIRAFYWSCLCNFPSLLSFNIEVLLLIFLLHGHEMLVTVIHAYVNCATGYGVSRFASYMYLRKCIHLVFYFKNIWEQHTGLFNLSVVYFFTDDYEETRFKCSFCGKMLRIDALVGRWSSNGKLNSLLFNFAYQLIIML